MEEILQGMKDEKDGLRGSLPTVRDNLSVH